jgi:hypothetical protein
MLFESKCCDLGQSYPIQDAEYTYQYLNDHAVTNTRRPNPRFDSQFIYMSMALLYLGAFQVHRSRIRFVRCARSIRGMD